MAQIKIRPDLFAAFNFNLDTKKPIGHLLELKIGTTTFEPKLNLQDPMQPKAKEGEAKGIVAIAKKAMGVITAIRWDGGFADPITLTCQVNAKSKEDAATLLHKGLVNTACDFKFCIYEYDYDAATPGYYKSFFSGDTALNGLIEKTNGQLEMEIDTEPSEIVPSPRNYELYLSLLPKDDATQTMTYAITATAAIVKGWGIQSVAPAGG